MRPIKVAGATLLLAGLLAGCIGPATGATPQNPPAPAGPTVAGWRLADEPDRGAVRWRRQALVHYEVPPPAY